MNRSGGRVASRIFAAFVAVVVLVFLLQTFGKGSYLLTEVVTKVRIAPFSSFAKLAAQGGGSLYAGLCARHYGKGNTAGRAWLYMSAWLGLWVVGQSILAFYENVLHVRAPLPSIGDLFFTVGYVFIILGLFAFVQAYRTSGFAVGSARDLAAVGIGACLMFAALAYLVLVPVALAPTPIGERLINVGYPLLDAVALIPALVLLRITIGFRGGKVWRIWATLLVGILFAMGGDIVFSDLTPAHMDSVGPLADLLFILGYSFCGYGMRLQYELVTE